MDAGSGSSFATYDPGACFCEMLHGHAAGSPHGRLVRERFASVPIAELRARARDAEIELFNQGITFTVYSEQRRDRPHPAVRRHPAPDLGRGLGGASRPACVQRVTALNLFLADIYHAQKVLADGVIPAELVLGNPNYRPEMRGVTLPLGTYVHVDGTDLVRGGDGRFLVLEDNARTPSGVSYVVENRHLMQRAFPDLMRRHAGCARSRTMAAGCSRRCARWPPPARRPAGRAAVARRVTTRAYFEHVFLAREMGVPLVEGRDLVVEDDRVWMRTVAGLRGST